MPFLSKRQQRFMYATKPKGVDLKEWADKTDFSKLPEKARKKKRKKDKSDALLTEPSWLVSDLDNADGCFPASLQEIIDSEDANDVFQGEESLESHGLPCTAGTKMDHLLKLAEMYEQAAKIAKDQIPGGLADGKSKKDFDSKALAKGRKVEMEHTDDPKKAEEIAMDHLTEDPKYYDKLKKMEEGECDKAKPAKSDKK